jgi:hypothetical protein
VTVEREDRERFVAGLRQVLQPRRLQFLEARVGEVGQFLVVAGEDDRVAREVGGLAVVIEVKEIGEHQDRAAGIDSRPGHLPGLIGIGGGTQPQRAALTLRQLQEVLLEAGGSAVGEAGGRLSVEHDVEEAGSGAEAEGHLLGDLGAVEGEEVAQRRGAAVVAGNVDVARDLDHGARGSGAHFAPRSFRYSARSLNERRISEVSSSRNSERYVSSVSIAIAK